MALAATRAPYTLFIVDDDNPYMKVQSIEAVKKCVMNNLGIAVVPSYSIIDELKSGALKQIVTEIDDKQYDSVYLYHKNKWISPQMELALKLLKKYVGMDSGSL